MERLTLWLTGDWRGLDDLRAGLQERAEVFPGDAGEGAAAEVVVLAASDGGIPADALARVRELSTAPVVLLAGELGGGLVAEAEAADVADVLILPQLAEAVIFAALRARAAAAPRRRDEEPRDGRVVTVFSPKGGTGKSVLATNLAAASAARGLRTLLLDLDLQFGDVAVLTGLEPRTTLLDLVAAPGQVDADKVAGYATRHGSGFDVLPAPLRPEDAELVSDAGVAGVLDGARPGYDVIVVDSPPAFTPPLLTALDRSDLLLLVTVPDVASLKNLRLALQTLELLSYPQARVRVVLNRASARLGLGAGQIATVLERPVEFELPEDELVCIGVNRGTPAVLMRSESPYASAVDALAAALLVPAEAGARPRRRRILVRGRRS